MGWCKWQFFILVVSDICLSLHILSLRSVLNSKLCNVWVYHTIEVGHVNPRLVPQQNSYRAMREVFPLVTADLSTLVCGIKYADCNGSVKELVQISAVNTIFHTDACLVVWGLHLLLLEELCFSSCMYEQHCDNVAAVCSFLGCDSQVHGAIIGLHGGRNCLSGDTVSHPTQLISPSLLH